MALDNLTYKQVDEIINTAAQDWRLYHYNGGQAYIRLTSGVDALLVIDHTTFPIQASVLDGTQYFAEYQHNARVYSRMMQDNPSSLAELVR